jgi:hypothetical protein
VAQASEQHDAGDEMQVREDQLLFSLRPLRVLCGSVVSMMYGTLTTAATEDAEEAQRLVNIRTLPPPVILRLR